MQRPRILTTRKRVLWRTRPAGSRAGFTLIEAMLVFFVIALTGLMFAAIFPTAQTSRVKAAHASFAAGLAQQKMEEIRAAGYVNIQLTPGVDTPLDSLPNGNQRVTITQYAANIKKVQVTITWSGYRQVGGTVNLVTLISDHS